MSEELTMIKAIDFFNTYRQDLYTMFKQYLEEDDANVMVSTLKAKYRDYDFAYTSEGDCEDAIDDIITLNGNYYKEMLSNYKKEFDYTTGITKTTTNEGENTELLVDLPNKVIDSNDYFKYPSNANNDKQSLTVTQTDPSRMIYLKNQYLRQVRNLYDEFAEKFRILFMNTY